MTTHRFTLEPVPPFRLDLTVWALRRRPHNAVDRWDGSAYRRTFAISDRLIEVEVRQPDPPDAPRLLVAVVTALPAHRAQVEVTPALQRMLGLDVDLSDFYRRAEGDLHLRPLARRFRGLKPPRYPTMFECLANAIACQQLTLTVGIGLLNRLAERHGRFDADAPHAFPDPANLATVDPGAIRALGFSAAKARALTELATRLHGGLDLERLSAVDDDEASGALQRLRGIGRWSAEYALLRGLGRLAVFPGDDVGARNNLQRLLGVDLDAGYDAVRHAVIPWSPYAGLVYFHLLLDHIDRAGWLDDNATSAHANAPGETPWPWTASEPAIDSTSGRSPTRSSGWAHSTRSPR